VPTVKEAGSLSQDDAWFVFDQALAVAGSLDLDLSNGYYIYIMAALYFAVPAVTGQLVLGAKASLGGLATQAIGQSATEAGNAGKAATVGENANKIGMNQQAIDQTARMKSYRQSGLAQQSFDQQNAAMDADVRGMEIGAASKALETAGAGRQIMADAQKPAAAKAQTELQLGGKAAAFVFGPKTPPPGPAVNSPNPAFGGTARLPSAQADDGTGFIENPAEAIRDKQSNTNMNSGKEAVKGDSLQPSKMDTAGKVANGIISYGSLSHQNALTQRAGGMRAFASARGLDLGIDKSGLDMFKGAHQAYGQRMSPLADYEAASAAWDEKAKYSGLSGLLGVYGGNPGSGL
jgi:hypothetical protein